jgi:phosphopantothenate-cysteine ligase/phosphopantothenoylcysteine decarboxylase/phosphopantothenate--cysteine ligase
MSLAGRWSEGKPPSVSFSVCLLSRVVSPMNILVTAGNSLTPIDRVRCITNIFTGRTGGAVALACHDRGHEVTLVTSHPEAVFDLREHGPPTDPRWRLRPYRTFDELQQRMGALIKGGGIDAVIHTAAVSDFRTAGVYSPAEGTRFRAEDRRWEAEGGGPPALEDRAAGKVKSDGPELWLRLVPAPKIIDQVRAEWGFQGVLVKFKLEVGLGEEELLEIAEKSRRVSAADLMVANTLEGAGDWALLGPVEGGYRRVSRRELGPRLLEAVERLHREKAHG